MLSRTLWKPALLAALACWQLGATQLLVTGTDVDGDWIDDSFHIVRSPVNPVTDDPAYLAADLIQPATGGEWLASEMMQWLAPIPNVYNGFEVPSCEYYCAARFVLSEPVAGLSLWGCWAVEGIGTEFR